MHIRPASEGSGGDAGPKYLGGNRRGNGPGVAAQHSRSISVGDHRGKWRDVVVPWSGVHAHQQGWRGVDRLFLGCNRLDDEPARPLRGIRTHTLPLRKQGMLPDLVFAVRPTLGRRMCVQPANVSGAKGLRSSTIACQTSVQGGVQFPALMAALGHSHELFSVSVARVSIVLAQPHVCR